MRIRKLDPLSASTRSADWGMCASLALVLVFLTLVSAVQGQSKAGRRSGVERSPNSLSQAEKAAGWKLLFDGKTWNGWRGFRREKVPVEGWGIGHGTFKHRAGQGR